MYLIYITEDPWIEKKKVGRKTFVACCLQMSLIMPHSYGIKKKNGKKKCIANKQDFWRLHHAMRFIKEEPKQENPTMVDPEPGPSRKTEK